MTLDSADGAAGTPRVRGLALVRHGATDWSRRGLHTGRTDLELLDAGYAEALAAADLVEPLPIVAAFMSPLRRARETAAALRLDIAITPVDDLLEWDYGDYEGRSSADIHAERPDWDLFRDGCPGGEQPAEVAARADAMLGRLDIAPDAAGLALVVAHGHILRVLATRYLGFALDAGHQLPMGSAHLSVLGHEHANRAIELWNLDSSLGASRLAGRASS